MKKLLWSSAIALALFSCAEHKEAKKEVIETIELSEELMSSEVLDGDSIIERTVTTDTVIKGNDTIIKVSVEEIIHQAPDQEKIDSIKVEKKIIKKKHK